MHWKWLRITADSPSTDFRLKMELSLAVLEFFLSLFFLWINCLKNARIKMRSLGENRQGLGNISLSLRSHALYSPSLRVTLSNSHSLSLSLCNSHFLNFSKLSLSLSM